VNHLGRIFQNIVLICLSLAAFLPGRVFAADPYAEAARELAGKIVSNISPPAEVGFTFQSLVPWDPKEIAAARQAMENELRARGLKLVKNSPSEKKIKITLAENFQHYIWIAEIPSDPGYRVVMTTQAKILEAPAGAVLRMTIQSRLIYEQNDPILDVKQFGSGNEMLVLDSKRLALFKLQNDRWKIESSAPLNPPHPFPRDIRGRLEDTGDTIRVHLPGLSCNGTMKPAVVLNCSQDETPWPLGLGSMTPTFSKNFFAQENLPPFFSAARVEDDGTELFVLAGTDGRTHLFDKAANSDEKFDGWGSEIAAIDSECGAHRQIFAALSTDPLEHSVIQAFEITQRKAVAASSTVTFPGPITALWTVTNQNAAIAVSHNIKTGQYAAFYLSIACSR
jgi:hypothetical protein